MTNMFESLELNILQRLEEYIEEYGDGYCYLSDRYEEFISSLLELLIKIDEVKRRNIVSRIKKNEELKKKPKRISKRKQRKIVKEQWEEFRRTHHMGEEKEDE